MEPHGLARATAFTDAAAAIALTLLVLPLVDEAQEAVETPVGVMMRAHSGDFLAFVISFFVVMLFWRAHRRVFAQLRHLDETLLTLNSFWLLGVVFVPVPTAVLTFEGGAETGAATLYLVNLLFVAAMGLAITAWIRFRPDLYAQEHAPTVRSHLHRAAVIAGMLALATALSVAIGTGALLLLIALPVVQRIVLRRSRSR